MKPKNNQSSPQTQQEAMKAAKSVQKPNQTKEQTKLIAQGIEKGITLYKKQQKEKQRDADKLRKKHIKTGAELESSQNDKQNAITTTKQPTNNIAWLLLALSWISFITYLSFQ
ncbi:DUF2956 domain-containing protein [Vibrio sp. S17_S38]|uniref:DUF2956 domain-containing protein n=1 Tax=Vibrio sp. S17_S38 TaxID=2720229 RepID=UPI001680696D|nr:DUF2956 domain-containing protein [Vibrio sp. S17_S38]MBD1571892.1 DUF2956 domain-containing protein [Vibrio sp. S17_S38]